jgi:hypothetical protein
MDNSVKIIDSGQVGQGRQLYDALLVAEGEVIALLDDDDLFLENKLEYMLNNFNSNEQLIYVHNQYLNLKGTKLIDKTIYKDIKYNVLIHDSNVRTLKKYYRFGIYSNSSSICFRKNFILKYSQILVKTEFRIDFLILFLALIEEGDLLFTNKKLTIYRVHDSDSHTIMWDKIIDRRKTVINSWNKTNLLLLDFIKKKDIVELIKVDSSIQRLNLEILGVNEGITFEDFKNLLKYLNLNRNTYSLFVFCFYVISKFSKDLSKCLLRNILQRYYKDFY